MKESIQPVPNKTRQFLQEQLKPTHPDVDFTDTATAFAHKSDRELRHAYRLFSFMNKPNLVRWGSSLGSLAVKYGLPFAEKITIKTIYRQFVGGRTLLEVEKVAKELAFYHVLTVLDYGAEGKHTESAYNHTMTECIRAIEFVALHPSIPVVTTKLSGLTSDKLLVDLSANNALSPAAEEQHKALLKRVDSLCHVATERGVQLYFDAEESWMQAAIDSIVLLAMKRYNKERAVVFNTYQLYRHDRLTALEDHYSVCRSHNVLLGAKLVRGAYMDKERKRAAERGYESPIQASKADTDRDFDLAVEYCLDRIDKINFLNASHNQDSASKMIAGMRARKIEKHHPHIMFCQLYGMSDNMTFNLAAAGYRTGKYVPYGPVADVVPYLVRRAHENTSITGEASRELVLVEKETNRRAALKKR